MTEIEDFIENYLKSDFESIRFNWNGKHGDEFHDPNRDFRIKVCEYLVDDLTIAPDELIVDLYTELSKSSRESWEVYGKYHLFAQELIKRGPIKNLEIYIQGARQSFDTAIASGRISVSDETKQQILNYLKTESAKGSLSLSESDIEFANHRFKIT